MVKVLKRKTKEVLFLSITVFLLFYFGVFTHLLEKDFKDFHYPYDGDIEKFIQELRANITPEVPPINSYHYHYYKSCSLKCKGVSDLRLVYIIKSSPENAYKRTAIRTTWGYEHRFSDVEIRRVFLIGELNENTHLQALIDQEAQRFQDIVQGNFTDTYFNNTYKTMMGFEWAVKFCSNGQFFMFVDDDYYVSTKNVLRFIRNPTDYPNYLKRFYNNYSQRKINQLDFKLDDNIRLYSGYAFKSAPHRHYSSKWYVSLDEYPYHQWPPYVTAGAYILSKEALFDMFYASYYTKHFRFDDIYLSLLAYKSKIEPFHCSEFYFYKLTYNPRNYQFVIASHGFSNPEQLLAAWTEQKSLGNA